MYNENIQQILYEIGNFFNITLIIYEIFKN